MAQYSLRDVYHAACHEPHFDYVFWLHITLDIIMDFFLRQVGRVLVIFASVLISLLTIIGFFFILPSVAEPYTPWYLFNVVWGILMMDSVFYHYFKAVFSDPGRPTYMHINTTQHAALKYCKKCNLHKPKRTHHCSVCGKCTLRMDHHCPWINNCVGLNNYKYFISFLFWATTATLYLTFLTIPRTYGTIFPDGLFPQNALKSYLRQNLESIEKNSIFTEIFNSVQSRMAPPDIISMNNTRILAASSNIYWKVVTELIPDEELIFIICTVTSFGVAIGTSLLLLFHIMIFWKGLTTIEYFSLSMTPNPSLSSPTIERSRPNIDFTRNYQEIFGRDIPWYLVLLPHIYDVYPPKPWNTTSNPDREETAIDWKNSLIRSNLTKSPSTVNGHVTSVSSRFQNKNVEDLMSNISSV